MMTALYLKIQQWFSMERYNLLGLDDWLLTDLVLCRPITFPSLLKFSTPTTLLSLFKSLTLAIPLP